MAIKLGTCLINWDSRNIAASLLHDNVCRLLSSKHIRFILSEYAHIGVTNIQCETIWFLANIYLFIEKSLICLIMRDAVYA